MTFLLIKKMFYTTSHEPCIKQNEKKVKVNINLFNIKNKNKNR